MGSRRQARIVTDGGRFTLEDLESKNDTYLRDQRLKASAALEDADTFRLGHASGLPRLAQSRDDHPES